MHLRSHDSRFPARRSLSILSAALVVGCTDAGPPVETPTTVGVGTLGGTGGDTGMDDAEVGDTDKLDVALSDLPPGDSEDCESVEEMGSLAPKPVDLILFVDTSGTMRPVSDEIETRINQLLADIVATGIDVRVIVIAGYGAEERLCFAAPLGPDNCLPPGPMPPVGPQLFFYELGLGSTGLLQFMLSTYTGVTGVQYEGLYEDVPMGWRGWLRAEAKKTFLVVTDADSLGGGAAEGTQWDADLLALDPVQFGTPDARNYVLHTIVGIGPNDPVDAPWPPNAPIVTTECGSEVGTGAPLQQIAILTGGLRYPLCHPENIGVLLTALAATVIESTPVTCDIAIPEPAEGETIDPDTLEVEYESGLGAIEVFHQVPNLAACEPDAFWVDATDIHLCTESCALVQADEAATVRVRYGCDVGYYPSG
jgi:hypothetical protein